MKQFFGALFILAAVVFLYKAGILMPDLASAFGGLKYSYSPTYVPADSLNTSYNAASYNAAANGNYYEYQYAPAQAEPRYYRSGARPIICYTSHMPIVNGVNYNYPVICNDIPSYSTPGESFPAPAMYPTSYPAPAYYPSYSPNVVPTRPPQVNPQTCY